jgi:hypothetical protein
MSSFFKKQLAFGQIYEKKLLNHIECDTYIIKEGLFCDYDLKTYTNGVKTKYEVKADKFTYKTNNIVIEYMCYNKPSGISLTRADYYAYFVVKPYDLYDLYIIPVPKIKELIDNGAYKRILKGGDKMLSFMYVFDIEIFKEFKVFPEEKKC